MRRYLQAATVFFVENFQRFRNPALTASGVLEACSLRFLTRGVLCAAPGKAGLGANTGNSQLVYRVSGLCLIVAVSCLFVVDAARCKTPATFHGFQYSRVRRLNR
ncbi:hypothetical protein [Pantoea sp. M_9]|uniref:hypothetical protein n=1 Tax=Pantoea sp. M_9 TaxID=2608041 RepID=UPI001231FA1B|nr:hypothetical protein [Pantoea sp. M_9]KAA5971622.1 hypothetical protein F3I15_05565 [Pantoea sp. M_9]